MKYISFLMHHLVLRSCERTSQNRQIGYNANGIYKLKYH